MIFMVVGGRVRAAGLGGPVIPALHPKNSPSALAKKNNKGLVFASGKEKFVAPDLRGAGQFGPRKKNSSAFAVLAKESASQKAVSNSRFGALSGNINPPVLKRKKLSVHVELARARNFNKHGKWSKG